MGVSDPDLIRSIIKRFYDRLFADVMIGYLFQGFDKNLLIERQVEFTLSALAMGARYQGRPLKEVHRPLAIRPGHFHRRQVILKSVLEEYQLSPEERDAWLEREAKLKPLIIHEKACPW